MKLLLSVKPALAADDALAALSGEEASAFFTLDG